MADAKGGRARLRHEILSRRRQVTEEESLAAGRAVLSFLMDDPFFKIPRTVASYVAVRGEVATAPINSWLLDGGHALALPVVDKERDGEMGFYRATASTTLAPGRYGIGEPEALPGLLVGNSDLDAVLLPLVGFDLEGNRLGMGGGYYDRLLKRVRPQARLIGIAYDFQKVERLEAESWDMRMDEVITPSGRLRFARG
ncbi:MAG: 5-formyltetrahydrofolate cyclo-ligase [Succinivibrio sp.]